MTQHKRQHWIPQSYLAAWCDPETPAEQEPYVWVFAKDGSSRKRKAPENVFFESELYTIKSPDGGRDLRIEHGLSELESLFAGVRRDILSARKPIDAEVRLIIAAFTAAMQARTVAHRNHWRKQWGEVLKDMDGMRNAMRNATQEQRQIARSIAPVDRSNSLGYEDVQKLATEPLQQALIPIIGTQTPLLYAMNLTIVVTDQDPGFITSDNPCVWFDPALQGQSWQGPGLASPTIEVTLPLSPLQLLLFSHRAQPGYVSPKSERAVDEMNRRTRGHADKNFVVCRDVLRSYWLETGDPSWARVGGPRYDRNGVRVDS